MPEFDPSDFRDRQPWQFGEATGEAEIELDARHGLVGRAHGRARRGRRRDASPRPTRGIDLLAGWVLRQDGQGAAARRPPELVDEVAAGPRRASSSATRASRRKPPPPEDRSGRRSRSSAPPGPVAPERFAVLQALLAHLLARCGDETRATIPAQELVERFHIPYDQLDDHLQLLNLVNFGGGCYAVYAVAGRRRGARRQGALRRRVPAPAAADAARGARDPPRARVRRADDRRRGADAARARPPEARGDLRRVRHAGGRRSRTPAPRRSSSSARSRRRSASSGSSRSSTSRSARRRASA